MLLLSLLLLDLDRQIETLHKEQKKLNRELEDAKREERSQQEKLDEEAKELEKLSNKQSILIKKVKLGIRSMLLIMS